MNYYLLIFNGYKLGIRDEKKYEELRDLFNNTVRYQLIPFITLKMCSYYNDKLSDRDIAVDVSKVVAFFQVSEEEFINTFSYDELSQYFNTRERPVGVSCNGNTI